MFLIASMLNKLNFKTIVIVVIAIIGVFFIGRFSVGKQTLTAHQPNRDETLNRYADATYTNPILTCIDPQKIDMRELKTFKKDINQYITNVLKTSPDLHVSFYFRDLNNGITIGVNERELFSPASLMKVPVLISVLKAAETKPDLLNTKIQYLKSNFNGIDEDGGFSKTDKEYYTVDEYLKHMIVYSDNASTLLLAKFIGIDNIMQTEKELNLNHANTADSHTNFVSVLRYAAVFRILYNASYLSKPMSEKALQLLTQVNYKNGIRSAIPSQYAIAHKYGERDVFDEKGKRNTLQLHHFGIVYYTGKPYIIGVMTRGGNKQLKEKVIKDLAEIAFKSVEYQINKGEKAVFSE